MKEGDTLPTRLVVSGMWGMDIGYFPAEYCIGGTVPNHKENTFCILAADAVGSYPHLDSQTTAKVILEQT